MTQPARPLTRTDRLRAFHASRVNAATAAYNAAIEAGNQPAALGWAAVAAAHRFVGVTTDAHVSEASDNAEALHHAANQQYAIKA